MSYTTCYRTTLYCPDHPTAGILHEWDRTQYHIRGGESGSPIDSNHRYYCTVCKRKLVENTNDAKTGNLTEYDRMDKRLLVEALEDKEPEYKDLVD